VADEAFSTCLGDHPGPVLPWWIMSHVLGVAAFQLGNPVAFLVLTEANNSSLNG
jgi:hypothetical protein